VTYAVLHTNAGPIRVELFDNPRPQTVQELRGVGRGHTGTTSNPRTGQKGSGPY